MQFKFIQAKKKNKHAEEFEKSLIVKNFRKKVNEQNFQEDSAIKMLPSC